MSADDDRSIHSVRCSTVYEVNGVRYERLEGIPAEARKLVKEADGNGIPDVFDDFVNQAKRGSNPKITTVRIEKVVSTSIDGGMAGLVRQRLLRDKTRPVKINCHACGYDLSGTAVGGKCPECGTEVAASLLKLVEPPWWYTSSRRTSSRRLIRLLVPIAFILLGVLIIASHLFD